MVGTVIVGRAQAHALDLAAPGDLRIAGSRPMLTATPPGWSIYCMDAAGWLMVDVPEAVLASEPFVHVAQFRRATRLGVMPFGILPGIAAGRALPVFSIGRCGSTLLSRLLAATGPRVANEHDAFTGIGRAAGDRPGDARLHRELVRRAAEAAGHIAAAAGTAAGPVVLKFRSQASDGAAAIVAGCGAPRAAFLVRALIPWARSMHRHFPDVPPDALARQLARHVSGVAGARRAGCDVIVSRYRDLVEAPGPTVATISGRSVPDTALAAVMQRDSQAGTAVARTAPRPGPDPNWRARFADEWAGCAPDADLALLGLDRTMTAVSRNGP